MSEKNFLWDEDKSSKLEESIILQESLDSINLSVTKEEQCQIKLNIKKIKKYIWIFIAFLVILLSILWLNPLKQSENLEKKIDYYQKHKNITEKYTFECFEKNIIYIISYIKLKQFSSNDTKWDDNIKTEFFSLKHNLEMEELSNEDLINKLKQSEINFLKGNYNQSIHLLNQILSLFRFIDIQELKRHIDLVNKTSIDIDGKDIVLFLGYSGAGKSTTVLFLSGLKMVWAKLNHLPHITTEKEIINPSLKQITTSPFSMSETKHISVVNLKKYKEIFLCDTPGFDNTNGPEVNIANTIGINLLVTKAKSVRPVILISSKSIGDRAIGLKGLATIIINMIPNINDHIHSFNYIFTKFSKDNKNEINAILEDIRKNLNDDEKKESFLIFYDDIIRKSVKNIILDPVNDSPDKIIDQLISQGKIENPHQFIHPSLSVSTNDAIHKQMLSHKSSILVAAKRKNFNLVEYSINELKYLNVILKSDYGLNIYNSCVKSLSELLQNYYEKEVISFSKFSTEREVYRFSEVINIANDYESLLQSHLNNLNVGKNSLFEEINRKVLNLYDQIKKSNLEKILIISSNLDKLLFISNVFPQYRTKFEESAKLFYDKLKSIEILFKSYLHQNNFNECGQLMKMILDYMPSNKYIDLNVIDKVYTNLKVEFLSYIKKINDNISSYFTKIYFSEEEFKEINKVMKLVEEVKDSLILKDHFPDNEHISFYNKLKDQILNLYENISNKISVLLDDHKIISFKEIKILFQQQTNLRSIYVIESLTSDNYYKTLEIIGSNISKVRFEITNFLINLDQNLEKIDFNKIYESILTIENTKWIENYKSGLYKENKKEICNRILDHLRKLELSIYAIPLDIDKIDDLKLYLKKYREINLFKPLEKNAYLLEIAEVIKNVNVFHEKTVYLIYERIDNLINEKSLDFKSLERFLMFLHSYLENNFLNNELVKANLRKLELYIIKYSTSVQDDIDYKLNNLFMGLFSNKDELFKVTNLIEKRLQEISDIKLKYPHLHIIFDMDKNLLDHYRIIIDKYANEFNDKLSNLLVTGQNGEFNRQLIITKSLSTLDRFTENYKFFDVYKNILNIQINQTSVIRDEVVRAIQNHNYNYVKKCFLQYSKSEDSFSKFQLSEIKTFLNNFLDSFIKEIDDKAKFSILADKIKIDQLQLLMDLIKKLYNARELLYDYLDNPSKIDKCNDAIQNYLLLGMKDYIDSINNHIESNDFHEAETEIKNLDIICTILDKYCKLTILNRIEELKIGLNKRIKEITKEYINLDIRRYNMYPPKDIFDKIQRTKNKKESIKLIEELEENILSNYKSELEKLKYLGKYEKNKDIIRLQKSISYLPNKLKNVVELIIEFAIQDLDNFDEKINKELDIAISSKDFQKISNLYDNTNYLNVNDPFIIRIADYLYNTNNDFHLKILSILKPSDSFIKSFINFKDFLNFRKIFGKKDLTKKINITYNIIMNEYSSKFTECKNILVNLFERKSENSTIEIGISSKAEIAFTNLEKILNKSKMMKWHEIINEIYPNLHQDLLKISKSIAISLNNSINIFNEKMKNLDFLELKLLLKNMKNWDKILNRIKLKNQIIIKLDDHELEKTVIQKSKSYQRMVEEILIKLEDIKNSITSIELNNDFFKESRDKLYFNLNIQFSILNKAKILIPEISESVIIKIEDDCIIYIGNKLEELLHFKSILEQSIIDIKDWNHLNRVVNNIVSFKKHVEVKLLNQKASIKDIHDKFMALADTIHLSSKNNSNIEEVSESLIKLKLMSESVPYFKQKIDYKLNDVLNEFKKKGGSEITKLGILLDQNRFGKLIVTENKCFDGYSISIFNTKIQVHDINYVLQHLEGNNIDIVLLSNFFFEFDITYKQLVKKYLSKKPAIFQLIKEIKLLTEGIINYSSRITKFYNQLLISNIYWDSHVKSKVTKLLAHIFALWTIKNSHHYFDARGVNNRETYLLQPHPAQVISIFRILGIGDKNVDLSNNLVQIGTGEGKSITLAVTSIVFSLLGFDVSVVCYSDYLSQRDYNSFLSLFNDLEVSNLINYGTFNKLSERIINQNLDIRKAVFDLISTNIKTNYYKPISTKQRILLIDEVDVFFSKDFYGNLYSPSTPLRNSCVIDLINLIWKEKSSITKKQIESSNEFKSCLNIYKGWEFIFQEALLDLIYDVKNYFHDYIVINDKIGYKEQDNIVVNAAYGYKTLFAYFEEHEKGNISKQSLEENININVKSGIFSFSEIPKLFLYKMGVSGTLKSLCESEREIIENEYNFKQFTYMPSVFGLNNLRFNEKNDIFLENSNDYFKRIANEINLRMHGKLVDTKRAVIVFFENNPKLTEFYKSIEFSIYKENSSILNEEADNFEKEHLIKQATMSDRITLATSSFGRGTDFVVRDQIVSANGGVHVIQTFLSEQLSEEIQIKGRTARQGENGSFSIVLQEKELEKFLIFSKDIINNQNELYKFLNLKRNTFFAGNYKNNHKYVESIREMHLKSMNFLLNLKEDIDKTKTFLNLINKSPYVYNEECFKTLVLMDGTLSMSNLLNKAKNTVEEMFRRAQEILLIKNINSCFELKFTIYRNYNCRSNDILVVSPWVNKAEILRTFLDKIYPMCGWGNEAIELGLAYANEEHKINDISQIILIGDQPSNSKAEVISKRIVEFGEEYWLKTKYSIPTFYLDELEQIIENKIPIHAFYVDNNAKENFNEISQKTQGVTNFLDIHSSSGADMLTNMVTTQILKNIGNKKGVGDLLVDEYYKKYGKSYK